MPRSKLNDILIIHKRFIIIPKYGFSRISENLNSQASLSWEYECREEC
jgi:hypothetical protein